MIPDHLRLQPGQQELTLAQEVEAWRFADECIRRQLSTEPADEQETEALLYQAYQVTGLRPPQHVYWLDGPLQLVAVMMQPSREGSVSGSVGDSVRESVGHSVELTVEEHVQIRVWDSVWTNVGASVEAGVFDSMRDSVGVSVRESVRESVGAYFHACWLAFSQFFDVYLAPNALHALAHFNAQVSGYWLGQEEAILVRRPKVLSRDAQGRLHSATGKCVEYPDGWGLYAWHGVRVPEQVILRPETLVSYVQEQHC